MPSYDLLGIQRRAASWEVAEAPRVSPVPTPLTSVAPRDICIATPDIVGPTRNGGIGTACTAIARTWAAAGHRVTILFALGNFAEAEGVETSVSRYAAEGITLVPCPPAPCRITLPSRYFQIAYDVFYWLKPRHFDLIYFPEWTGCGHYTLAARRLGLGFQNTGMVVGTHSPSFWHLEGNHRLPHDADPLCADALERAVVSAADAVISPSAYMLEWLRNNGWSPPPASHVLANPMPAHARGAVRSAATTGIDEIVFFGRLEARKGLLLFLAAIRRMEPELLARVRVTFLGKPGDAAGDPLAAISASRPEKVGGWQILTDLDATAAGRYIAAAGRLPVMPSLVENSPMTVLECLGLGIPFLAARVGGIPELLHPEDRDRYLFEPTPPMLAAAICNALATGLASARPASGIEATDRAWRDVVSAYSAPPARQVATAPGMPRVSVILITRNRPRTLAQAVEGLRRQTWPNLEVVLVDDGSDHQEAIAVLDQLEPEFLGRGWRILRQPNRYLGAARNAGWRISSGEYIVFHDDDNISLPHLVETFVRAAEHSGADIVTASMAEFSGDAPPETDIGASPQVYAPIGGVLAAGAFFNLYGDAQACYRRSVLEHLRGFSEDFGLGHEDWELFARATLSGLSVLAIPEPMFWYRVSATSMLRSQRNLDGDLMRGVRPFFEVLPPQLRPILAFSLRRNSLAPDGTLNRLIRRWEALAVHPAMGPPLRLAWRLVRPTLRRLLGSGRS